MRCRPAVFALFILPSFCQSRVDSSSLYERVLAVVPLAGAGVLWGV